MSNKLAGFLKATILRGTIPELETLCADTFSTFGIKHYLCANIYGLECAANRKPLFGTYESDWMKHYMQKSLFIDDPLMRNSRGINNNGLPYYWSDLQMATSLTPQQNKVFEEA